MPLPNTTKLNLILDLLLDFLLESYILWDMKILVVLKLCLTVKKILYVLDVNLLDCLCNQNYLLIKYFETKLFALKKDNKMMKQYLENKDYLQSLRPRLIFNVSQEIKKRDEYKISLEEIMTNDSNPKKEANDKNYDESEGLKNLKANQIY